MTALTVDAREPEQFGEFALWVVAAIIVVALHLGLAVAYLWLKPEPEMRAEAPAFDVAFMPASRAPAAAPSIDQPEPAPTKLDPPQDQPKDLPPPVPEQEAPPPMPQVEAMVPLEPPPPAPAIPVQPELPPPVPQQATIVPTEKPPEVTVPDKPVVVPAPPPKVMHEEIERREKAEKPEEKVEKHQAPPKSVASPGTRPMRVASAPNPGAESEGARVGRESWLSELAAHIRRFATYSAGNTRESGTVQLSVTIARNGRLVSRRLASSSGSPALDQAAMAVIERAQPFPPFPTSMPDAQVTKLVPLHLRPQ